MRQAVPGAVSNATYRDIRTRKRKYSHGNAATYLRIFACAVACLCAEKGGRCAEEVKPAQRTQMSVLVPAYFYPAGEGVKYWKQLEAAASKVAVTAIVNPASGPGEKPDPVYQELVKTLIQKKVRPIGYIDTNYAKRTEADVIADARSWLKMYPEVRGFFLDQQSSGVEAVEYYFGVCKALRGLKPKLLIVSNPGTVCDVKYFAEAGPDVICIHENDQSLSQCQPAESIINIAPERKYALVHTLKDRKAMAAEIALAQKLGIGQIFITDAILPNPWDRLPEPEYWEDFIGILAKQKK